MDLKDILKGSGLAAGAYAVGAALGKAAKEQKIEELPTQAKQVAGLAKVNIDLGEDYGNGAALTPPMGWSSWNTFSSRVSESLILEVADAMQKTGLADAGYVQVNIDDCWQSAQRDANGRLQSDFVTFPSGITELVRKVNARGLKLGIYSSNGTLTCEDLPASLGNEELDARTFAEWGVEYVKYDFCHNKPLPLRGPCIEKIAVGTLGSGTENVYEAQDAVLEGNAAIVDDDRMETGKYIAGLGYGGGAAVFTQVIAEEDGPHALTLCIRRKVRGERFAVIEVNGRFACDLLLLQPGMASLLNKDGRRQVVVNLKKGVNSIRIYNPIASRFDSAAYQYARMGKALKNATREYARAAGVPEKKITYSICEWGFNRPWKWGKRAGNLWRTTLDIKPFWAWILTIYEFNVRLWKHAGPGGWNDPDMLEVGNGALNYEENKAHFSLWCMMAAPLILGNDVREFLGPDGTADTANTAYKVVTNRDMIAIDQDPLGVQCRRIESTGLQDTLVKPLAGGEAAICFFNKASESKAFQLRLTAVAAKDFVDLPFADSYEVTDLWSHYSQAVGDEISCNVAPHGVRVFRVKAN